jgi:hypothetical protein
VLRALIVSVAVVAVALVVGGAASSQRPGRQVGSLGPSSPTRTGQVSCPQRVLVVESLTTPVAEALHAAQRLLARQEVNRQGNVFRLTPAQAPIDYIAQLAIVRTVLDEMTPGRLAIHRVAAAACGEAAAQASWALHYPVPGLTPSNQGYPFLVKTKTGWKFWGYWCGAGRSRTWYERYCF